MEPSDARLRVEAAVGGLRPEHLPIQPKAEGGGEGRAIQAGGAVVGVALPNVSCNMLNVACAKAGYPRRALRWIEELLGRGFESDAITMNPLMSLPGCSSGVAAIERALQSFSWDVETCNTMIDLYGRVGHLADASRLFPEMVALGIHPDTITFNPMIRVCGSAGKANEAEVVFSWMVADGGVLAPGFATFHVLLAMFVRDRIVEKALE